MVSRHRDKYAIIVLSFIMFAELWLLLKSPYIEENQFLMPVVSAITGILSIVAIRLYLVNIGETPLKYYVKAASSHKKAEKLFKRKDFKMADYYREMANKYREHAWGLEEKWKAKA